MSNRIERPIFFEGQILGAADLSATVEYHRGQSARHNRYMHLWGIAKGLDADVGKEVTEGTVTYLESIAIKPGVAIDGTGREIVVPEAFKLDEGTFVRSNLAIADATALYPVFLHGRYEPPPQQPMTVGICSTAQPTREIEGFEITFGRPSDVLDDQPEDPDVAAGPGEGWRILLGFVKWDATKKKFTEWSLDSKGVTPRYAGVKADVVEARGGKLSLRSAGEVGTPAIALDGNDAEGLLFRFGTLSDQGVVKPLLSINSSGDIKAEGTILGGRTVLIQSGIATDGIVIPLPSGVKEEEVESGQVALHISVTPRPYGATPPDNVNFDWIATPLECAIDGPTRRALCRYRWFRLGDLNTFYDVPGTCNYLVLASGPAANGG